jgi:O-acetyl-ADP-ribose deacetylase (regulator of RNase III)
MKFNQIMLSVLVLMAGNAQAGWCSDLSTKLSSWATKNPKEAAVTVGVAAMAGVLIYKYWNNPAVKAVQQPVFKQVKPMVVGSETTKTINLTANTQLIIQQGDITKCGAEAIVNAANQQLAGGAGVCGAIFKAAGINKLQAACNEHQANGTVRCPTGEARLTESFDLESSGTKHIIHAVGPIYSASTDPKEQDNLLQKAYQSSLRLADEHGIKAIAFPFISTGIYDYPKDRAARAALQAVLEHVQNQTGITQIHFALYPPKDFPEDFKAFCEAITEVTA